MKFSFLLIILFSSYHTIRQEPKIIITKADKELIPEGIAVHPKTGTIYLSSLHQNKIIAIDKNGFVKDLITEGQDGFMMGLGLKISLDGKTLWACSAYNDSITHKTGLFQIDLKNGTVVQKFVFSDTVDIFFNDLVIDRNENIYITDNQRSSVYKMNKKTNEVELWLKNDKLHWPNGITLSEDEKTLFVAAGDKGINAINISTKNIKTIAGPQTDFYAIDGLGFYKNTLIGVIGWPQDKPQTHRVLQYHLGADYKLLKIDTLNINKQEVNCPTTLSITNDQLYVLSKTNLGVYNRHNSNTSNIKDSLQPATILQYSLK